MQANLFVNENNYLLNYSLSPENNIIVESILDKDGNDQKANINYAEALALLQTEIHNQKLSEALHTDAHKVIEENTPEPAFKESDLSPVERKMEHQLEQLANIPPEKKEVGKKSSKK